LNRESLVVTIGRLYQKISVALTPIDKLICTLFGNKSNNSPPVICVLACPRSGSTLTYQIITTYFNSAYLSNLQNLLFATPYLGLQIAAMSSKNHRSTFRSKYGFVDGLNGEAEGLKYWSYWTGQTLEESSVWDKSKAEHLKVVLSKSNLEEKVIVTGYLGHVFCINELRNLFNNIRFVYLRRNLIDNAISILKADDSKVFSSKPDIEYSEDPLLRVSQQLLKIHYLIFENEKEDYVKLNFSDIISSPEDEMDKLLKSFADSQVKVGPKANHVKMFIASNTSYHSEYKRNDIAQALKLELSKYSNRFFVKEMMPLINDR